MFCHRHQQRHTGNTVLRSTVLRPTGGDLTPKNESCRLTGNEYNEVRLHEISINVFSFVRPSIVPRLFRIETPLGVTDLWTLFLMS